MNPSSTKNNRDLLPPDPYGVQPPDGGISAALPPPILRDHGTGRLKKKNKEDCASKLSLYNPLKMKKAGNFSLKSDGSWRNGSNLNLGNFALNEVTGSIGNKKDEIGEIYITSVGNGVAFTTSEGAGPINQAEVDKTQGGQSPIEGITPLLDDKIDRLEKSLDPQDQVMRNGDDSVEVIAQNVPISNGPGRANSPISYGVTPGIHGQNRNSKSPSPNFEGPNPWHLLHKNIPGIVRIGNEAGVESVGKSDDRVQDMDEVIFDKAAGSPVQQAAVGASGLGLECGGAPSNLENSEKCDNRKQGLTEPVLHNENQRNGIKAGVSTNNQNAWMSNSNGKPTFAEQIKLNNEREQTRLEYFPPVVSVEGVTRVVLSVDDLRYSAVNFPLQLYGYFLGTSMDYHVVNMCFKKVWKDYDLDSISKSSTGMYYFRFKSEKGLNEALVNGSWLVRNVPIFLNRWEPGVYLEKVEQKTIPLWVTIQNVPLELWTGRGLSKLVSGIGIPLLMDRVTQERCDNQSGKMGFARVLVEVDAANNLPESVEVEYPSI